MVKVNPIRNRKDIPRIKMNARSTPLTKLDALAVFDRIYIAFI